MAFQVEAKAWLHCAPSQAAHLHQPDAVLAKQQKLAAGGRSLLPIAVGGGPRLPKSEVDEAVVSCSAWGRAAVQAGSAEVTRAAMKVCMHGGSAASANVKPSGGLPHRTCVQHLPALPLAAAHGDDRRVPAVDGEERCSRAAMRSSQEGR